jgi:Flp pilus assembly pilin Flp
MAEVNRRGWRDERGAELIEFALIFPLLAFVLAGVADFGFMFQRHLAVTNAAREGARIAVLPGYSAADAERRVASYLESAGIPGGAETRVATVVLNSPGGGAPITAVRVSVEYPYRFLFIAPFVRLFGGSDGDVALKAVSTMRSEVQLGG